MNSSASSSGQCTILCSLCLNSTHYYVHPNIKLVLHQLIMEQRRNYRFYTKRYHFFYVYHNLCFCFALLSFILSSPPPTPSPVVDFASSFTYAESCVQSLDGLCDAQTSCARSDSLVMGRLKQFDCVFFLLRINGIYWRQQRDRKYAQHSQSIVVKISKKKKIPAK